ncbi:MAG: Gfo/Idh/MocA family protein, partial [Actinomycetota bacterium]
MKFAISGYGWAARMHADAIRIAGHEVVGVSGPNDERRHVFAEARGCRVSITDTAEMLAESGADALVVCSPNAIHTADALAAVDAGVHVLVEKPVTVTLEECEALAVRAAAKSVTVGVGHMWRHRTEVVALRDRIAAGDLGRVVRTHGWGVHAGWG